MRFENIDNIEFYTLESDEKKIYAEYMVSSDDGALPDVYKLICNKIWSLVEIREQIWSLKVQYKERWTLILIELAID